MLSVRSQEHGLISARLWHVARMSTKVAVRESVTEYRRVGSVECRWHQGSSLPTYRWIESLLAGVVSLASVLPDLLSAQHPHSFSTFPSRYPMWRLPVLVRADSGDIYAMGVKTWMRGLALTPDVMECSTLSADIVANISTPNVG